MNHYDWKFPRGDTIIKTVARKSPNGEIVPFVEGEEVRFTVKLNPNISELLIYKKITKFDKNGRATIKLEPQDTKKLAYGVYFYDIRLIVPSKNYVKTLIMCSRFHVLREITWIDD